MHDTALGTTTDVIIIKLRNQHIHKIKLILEHIHPHNIIILEDPETKNNTYNISHIYKSHMYTYK
jgi:hypothetical protein